METPTPIEIERYEDDYKEGAWKDYSIAELGHFVHLLAKRATHRSDSEKRGNDLRDARNYLRMIEAKLDALEKL